MLSNFTIPILLKAELESARKTTSNGMLTKKIDVCFLENGKPKVSEVFGYFFLNGAPRGEKLFWHPTACYFEGATYPRDFQTC